jgi:hypothetical protein
MSEDMSRTMVKPAAFKPDTHWNYSSGTTNFPVFYVNNSNASRIFFWYSALIDKIGMNSMVIETDMAGNYVGSSYGWATTRVGQNSVVVFAQR